MEQSFCLKRRYDEEATATLFSLQNEERRVQSHPVFFGRLAYGEGISERNPASKIDHDRKMLGTPAHSHNSFPSGIAVEPDEQQALTYLNRERKVF